MPAEPIVYQLGHEPIKDHVFSSSLDVLAITKGSTVQVYRTAANSPQKPQLVAELKGHDKTVTSVDISPDGSKILTCSQDRNALVWEYSASEQQYRPTLVLLRINRAATYCRWSPLGNKFAVGSSDRTIAVCYYEEENDWWVLKHLKKPLKSTITSLLWHPNNVLLASGLTDGHVRVFSTYTKGLDEKPGPSVWGSKLPFQTLCGDYTNETGAWVHDVDFGPTGNELAFVSHDSTVGVVYPQGEGLPPRAHVVARSSDLPFKSLCFASDSTIVVGGHNCNLVVFSGSEQSWAEAYHVEKQRDLVQEAAPAGDEDEEMSSHAALNMFKQLDLKGRVNKPAAGAGRALATIHQNTIASIRPYSAGKISTSGIDGKVVVFALK